MPEIFDKVLVQFGLTFESIYPGNLLQCKIKALKLAVREGGNITFTYNGWKWETSMDILIQNPKNWKLTDLTKKEQIDAQE